MFLQRRREARPSNEVDRMSLFAKRMPVAKLLDYLQLYSHSDPHHLLLCSKQCGLLIQAMQRVALWLSHQQTATLPAPFVQDLLSLATKGVRLLEECKHVNPSNWLSMAVYKMESREEFLELFQGFLQALESYVEVMQGPHPHVNTHNHPPSWRLCLRSVSSTGPQQTGIHEVTSLIASMEIDLHFLSLKAAEDRRALFERLEQASFTEGEEWKSSRFLMRRLEDKQMDINALQLDSPGIQFGALIGSGSYSKVYAATWKGLRIAVKQFHYQESLDAELKALLKTSHVNIMRAIGYVPETESSKPYLLMEQMKGDLDHFIKQLKVDLPFLVSVEILLQIASGMAHLHQKNVIHRDLKPENILFKWWPPMCAQDLDTGPGDFTAKITDFGESRTRMANTAYATAKRGTPCYRAPEILKGGDENGRTRYSNKVDVFSFGMVSYKLLTRLDPCLSGAKAWQGDCSELQFPPNFPRAFIFLMKRCWLTAHQKRPSFSEICDFLALVKSIVLNKLPANGCGLPLYSGIRDDLLVRLVAFLGKEWLMEEATSRGIKLEGTGHVEVDEEWLRLQVRNALVSRLEGDYLRRICWYNLRLGLFHFAIIDQLFFNLESF